MRRWLLMAPVLAQAPSAAARGRGALRPRRGRCRGRRTASRTCRGSGRTPRLRLWSGRRTSPRSFTHREEAARTGEDAAAAESEQTEPGTIADVHYDFTQFGLDRSQGGGALNLRTSLIVDPPDGRLPPLTAEGQKRAAERAAARKRMGGRHRRRAEPAAQRAVHHHGPRRAADASRGLQQQLSNRADAWIRDDSRRDDPSTSASSRWTGVRICRKTSASGWEATRGRWEGDTLVVETTNFTDKTAFQGSSENMRLTERFTRVDADTVMYSSRSTIRRRGQDPGPRSCR